MKYKEGDLCRLTGWNVTTALKGTIVLVVDAYIHPEDKSWAGTQPGTYTVLAGEKLKYNLSERALERA